MGVPGTRNFAVPPVAKGSLRNRAAYSSVPFPEPFTRFVRGPLLLDAAQRVFFSRRRALLPRALALAEGDEQCAAFSAERGFSGVRCSFYAFPFLPPHRVRDPRIIIAALFETREG